ncbi:1-acyl-sn-glycerol-3-phosphate acyltransferase [Eubacterium sp. AM49-13BH]|nr:1-acyl-sn-glycerol-3-phosphate acyltransferase [Eubacterium sp. AM49-13BH]
MVLHAVPKANKMIANKSSHSAEERFVYAKWIINYMRKHARTRTKVYGRENIPTDSNYIMYPNHQGKYDALGIILAQEKPCGVLWGKKQAERLMSRQVCGLIDAVVIDLDNNRDKVRAIMDVTRQVKSGRNFLIFPEGGYTDNKNELQEFQAGCFSCSLQTKTPIVPVALFDSYKSMNSNTFEKVDTQVHFLKPILYSEYGELKKKEVAELVKNRIAERMAQIKAGEINESYELIE